MKRRFFLVAMVLALVLAGCGQAPDESPRSLQAQLAEIIDGPAQCPTKTSADLQELLDASGPDDVVQIPAGCYEITDSIEISASKRLFEAGMDEAILHRDPESSQDQDKPVFWVFGHGQGKT